MYVPSLFKKDDLPALHEAIRSSGLATLITSGSEGLEASHVPLLLDAEAGPYGTLRGHIARANPQWRHTSPDVEALATFLGPDAYITPSWYATKRATGKVVPTWNYVAIHAYGPIRFFDDVDELRALVSKLTDRFERGREAAWAVDDAPAEFTLSQLRAIVGFSMPITRLQGKWKMSQNRPAEDRAGVIEGLSLSEAEGDRLVADIVARERRD